jgi:VanZ family protein
VPAFLVALAVSAAMLFSPSAPATGPFDGSDKVVHFLIFMTLAALGRRAGLSLPALAAGLVAYAIGSELIQGLEPNRSSSPTDALADACGILVGLSFWPVLLRWQRRS